MVLLSSLSTYAQNTSMVGDGFGGRAGYCPSNINLGYRHGYAVCGSNNQLYGWGQNTFYGFGAATPTLTTTAVAIPGMTNVIQFAGGNYINGAIKSDGTGWVWGLTNASNGNLNFPTPTQVITDAYQCDTEVEAHSVAFVKKDGTVWFTGRVDFGPTTFLTDCLGSTPCAIQIPGITNAKRVTLGRYYMLILLADGTVKYIGLFMSVTADNTVKPVSGLSNIVAIESNNGTALFLNSAGKVYSANYNTNSVTLVPFPSTAAPIKALGMTAYEGFMALDDNGNFYNWGNSLAGQLGNGLANNDATNIVVPELRATNVRDMKGGDNHAWIVKNDGTLWTTGSYDYFITSNTYRNTFTQIDPTAGGLCAIPTACFTGMAPCVAGTTAPALTSTTATNSCPIATVDLTSLAISSTTPSGASLIWSTHKTPTSAGDTLTTAQKTAVSTAGKYYAMYYDAANACYSPADSVDITITPCPINLANACPTATVNLTTAISASNMPSGASITWHTGTPATTANQVTDPTAISTSGTYYLAFFDGTNNCYSNTSQSVTVTITSCVPPLSANTPAAQTATTGAAKTGNAATELTPTGGTAPYTYSNGTGDVACVAPSGAAALPAGSNLTVNSSTGAYTYTAPSTAGTYYYCIKVCDSATPTPSCVVKTYTLTVSAPACTVTGVTPTFIKN